MTEKRFVPSLVEADPEAHESLTRRKELQVEDCDDGLDSVKGRALCFVMMFVDKDTGGLYYLDRGGPSMAMTNWMGDTIKDQAKLSVEEDL